MEKIMQMGGNTLIEKTDSVTVKVLWSPERIGGFDVDVSAFMLQDNQKVRGDNDFIFYNQPQTPDGSIHLDLASHSAILTLKLNKLPDNIQKIAIAITIHGSATFSDSSLVEISIDGVARFSPDTSSMAESALILGEIYRRNSDWKFRAVGQGFNGGLEPLAQHFGIEIKSESPTAQYQSTSNIPEASVSPDSTSHSVQNTSSSSAGEVSLAKLEKKLVSLEKSAPQLVSLAKKARVSLEKKGLSAHVASVGLCMDISASMSRVFENGTVQTIIERVMGLGLNFDDNGAIDIFSFGENAHDLGELLPEEFKDASAWILGQTPFEGSTQYAPAINCIMKHYGYMDGEKNSIFGSLFGKKESRSPVSYPAYILFITDGDNFDKAATERAIKAASHYPVFFQFIGIGRMTFQFLEKLDDMKGRHVDNANFFAIENPAKILESELYDRMMVEYPGWVRTIRSLGLIR